MYEGSFALSLEVYVKIHYGNILYVFLYLCFMVSSGCPGTPNWNAVWSAVQAIRGMKYYG
jgi:hypothetical protein